MRVFSLTALAAAASCVSCSSHDVRRTVGSSVAQAITQPSPPAPLTFPATPIVAAPPTARLPGHGWVTPSGEYRYEIPLEVPAGRAGLQPSLSLSYASRRQQGRAGVGWTIEGISVVEPCPKVFSADGVTDGVHFDATDTYCLDGHKLVLLAGVPGTQGAEYRTEDEIFARVLALGVVSKSAAVPTGFRVYGKDGRIREYHAIATAGGGPTVAFPIALERDRAGNEIDYKYTVSSSGPSDIEWDPTEIDYTAQANTGEPGRRAVKLSYFPPDDTLTAQRGGVRFHTTMGLYRVVMYAPNPTTTSEVWRYELDYSGNPTPTGRRLLGSVTWSGAAGGTALVKTFEWSSSAMTDFVSSGTITAPADEGSLVMDADGDGIDDLLTQDTVDYDIVTLHRTTDPAHPLATSTNWMYAGIDLKFATAADVNGDGKTELIAPLMGPAGYNAYSYASGTWTMGNTLGEYGADHDPLFTADLDGDGRSDLIFATVDPQASVIEGMPNRWDWFYEINHGTWFGSEVPIDGISGEHECYPIRADANAANQVFATDYGNGRASLILCQEGTRTLGVTYVPGKISPVQVDTVAMSQYDQPISAWADLNGDGVRDAVWIDTSPYAPSLDIDVSIPPDGSIATPDYTLPLTDPDVTQYLFAVADFDRDGRDEVVIVYRKTNTAYLLRMGLPGTDGPKMVPISIGPASALKVGDFDGDGKPDLLAFAPDGGTATIYHAQRTIDQMTYVLDGSSLPSEQIVYSSTYSPNQDTPNPSWCTYPLRCPSTAIDVVRERNVFQGYDVPGMQHHYFSYQQPVIDVAGRGFLGFTTTREWEPERPRETIRKYQFLGEAHGLGPQAYFERVTTPILSESYAGTIAHPTTATARIQATSTSFGIDSPDGLSYFLHPTAATKHEWEEPVSIDWSTSDAPNVLGIEGVGNDPAAVDLRTTNIEWSFDPYGNVLDYKTSGGGLPTRETARTFEYRPSDWLIALLSTETDTSSTTSSPIQHSSSFTYDALGNLYTYNVEPNDTNPALPLTLTYTRDADGQVRTVTATTLDAPPRHVYLDYDHNERVFRSQVWNDLGQSIFVLTQPAYGVPSVVMDTRGTKITRWFDDRGRPTRELPDGGMERDYDYAVRSVNGTLNRGEIVTATEAGGHVTSVSYDELGRAVARQHRGFDGSWIDTAATYDVLGHVISVTRPGVGAPSSDREQSRFDSLDRLVEVTQPDGGVVKYTQSFFETHRFDPMGHERYLVRDLDERVIESAEVHDRAPLVVQYTWGDFDVLKKMVDSQGNATAYTWDRRGRKIKVVDPDAGTSTFSYNGLGDLVGETQGGASTTYTIDAIGRPTQIESPDGTTTLTWDTLYPGKLTSGTSPDGTVHGFSYDPFGRETQQQWTVGPDTYSIERSYDPNGRPSLLYYPTVPGRAQLVVQRKYNPYGWLASVDDVTAGGDQALWTVNARNADDRLLQATFGNGVVATRTYDPPSGRLETLADGDVLALAYGYNADGLVISRSDSLRARSEMIGHDDLHRINEWDVTWSGTTNRYGYGYDDLGNLTSVTTNGVVMESNAYGDTALPHAITSAKIGSTFYTIDYFGYDARGRQTSGDGRSSVTYTEFDLPRTIAQASGTTTTFAYDFSGARVKKSSASGATLTLGGLYERRDTGMTQEHVFYVYGGRLPVAQINVTSTTYLHHDAIGSVVAATNSSGALVEHYDYEPFGKRVQPSGAPTSAAAGDVKMSFAEQRHDDELGLIDMHGRVYDPLARRFLTPDPLVGHPFDQQSHNRYSYVLNAPMDLVDPSGFDGEESSDSGNDSGNDSGDISGNDISGEIFVGGGGTGGAGATGYNGSYTGLAEGAEGAPPAPPPAAKTDAYGIILPPGVTSPSQLYAYDESRTCVGTSDSGCTVERTWEEDWVRDGKHVADTVAKVATAPARVAGTLTGNPELALVGNSLYAVYTGTVGTIEAHDHGQDGRAVLHAVTTVLSMRDAMSAVDDALASDPGGLAVRPIDSKRWTRTQTDDDRGQIYQREGGLCPYCDVVMTKEAGPHQMQLDHPNPFSRSGAIDPLQADGICRTCNQEKSDSLLEDWIEYLRESKF